MVDSDDPSISSYSERLKHEYERFVVPILEQLEQYVTVVSCGEREYDPTPPITAEQLEGLREAQNNVNTAHKKVFDRNIILSDTSTPEDIANAEQELKDAEKRAKKERGKLPKYCTLPVIDTAELKNLYSEPEYYQVMARLEQLTPDTDNAVVLNAPTLAKSNTGDLRLNSLRGTGDSILPAHILTLLDTFEELGVIRNDVLAGDEAGKSLPQKLTEMLRIIEDNGHIVMYHVGVQSYPSTSGPRREMETFVVPLNPQLLTFPPEDKRFTALVPVYEQGTCPVEVSCPGWNSFHFSLDTPPHLSLDTPQTPPPKEMMTMAGLPEVLSRCVAMAESAISHLNAQQERQETENNITGGMDGR